MKKERIPVYDICTIDQHSGKDLLIENLDSYLKKHYQHLHRPHRHSFYHLVLFTKGRGSHTIDFESFPVQPFQIYFMIPGQVHSWHFEAGVDGYVVHFNEEFFSNFFQNTYYLDRFNFFSGISTNGVCKVPVQYHASVTNLFDRMVREINSRDGLYDDMIRLLMLELFITIHRSCVPKKTKVISQQKTMIMRSFQKLIDRHFRTIRLPKEYADLLYITPNHLNALCKHMLGKTSGELIRDRVLLEAKRLLTNADMSVSEIAYDLNFQDNSYFNRFFKKNMGITPEEFRKDFINKAQS